LSKLTCFVLGLLLLFGCTLFSPVGLTETKTTVAVVDFTNLSGKDLDQIGEVANEVLSTLLHQNGNFTVIERAKLQSVLKEQGFTQSGLVDSTASALQVGRLLGAEFLVTGSILFYETKVNRFEGYGVVTEKTLYEMKVNVKILNVTTGQVEFASIIPVREEVVETGYANDITAGQPRSLLTKALTKTVNELAKSITEKEQPQAEKVMVSFNSTPPGADVEIDQIYYGNTPCTILLNPGVHNVKISLADYEPWLKRINAYEGLVVNATLEKKGEKEHKIITIEHDTN